MPLLYEELTGKILNAFYATYRNLAGRAGYNEQNYTRALIIELKRRGLVVEDQVYVNRIYDGEDLGGDFLDLVVENKVLVLVKKARQIRREYLEQGQTYLYDSKLAVGLILNFGADDPEFRRLYVPQNNRGES